MPCTHHHQEQDGGCYVKHHLISGIVLLRSEDCEVVFPRVISKAVSEGFLRHVKFILGACSRKFGTS